MINTIGCYIRLSQADNKSDESNSVVNQRMLIHNYINAHSELHGAQILDFVDDGYTGTNTDRPAFQRMIQMAQCGQIQCIIVKDFSRFARNYISIGDYMEQIFEWHKRVLESEDSQLQKQAGLMLFYHYLDAEDYTRAEEILEKFPQGYDEADWAKATLYGRQGKKSEAKQLLERKLLAAAGNVQQALSMMQVIALEEQDLDRAELLADTCSQAVKLLQLWGYGEYSTYLELYCAKQDVEGCIRIFDGMFAEIEKAWKLSETTLYKDMPTKEEDVHLPNMMKDKLVDLLLHEEHLDFFRQSEKGREYLEKI